jgi:hypothetical protein
METEHEAQDMEPVAGGEQEAEGLAPEEVWARIAERVRSDSKEGVRLTAVDSLGELLPGLDAETIPAYLSQMAEQEAYGDVRPIATASGRAFLYSEQGMTGKYAEILVRIEEDDPCATIAETVRSDSRTYPRPTNVSLFRQPPFRMSADELEAAISRTLAAYEDIQRIEASTGAVYLYSNRFMKDALAKSHVRWLEVEQYENP